MYGPGAGLGKPSEINALPYGTGSHAKTEAQQSMECVDDGPRNATFAVKAYKHRIRLQCSNETPTICRLPQIRSEVLLCCQLFYLFRCVFV